MGMKWDQILANRSASIHDAIALPNYRELPDHPDMIRFFGGTPSPENLPVDYLRECMTRAWEIPHATLYYGETDGHGPLLELISERMGRRGVDVPPEGILVTNGAQQGLDLVSRALLDPGDSVIVEAPTYFGALQIFDMYEARYASVEMDEEGMIPESLEEALRRAERPKFIYSIPTYQNPTGVSIASHRRSRIVELAERYNVPIVEDDPYGEIWFGDRGLNPLRAESEQVIYLGTFSKTIAPALRMGWVIAPETLLNVLRFAKEASDIGSDRMVQRMVVNAAADGWLDDHLAVARSGYESRYRQLVDALEREMPGDVTWTTPAGGFFLWVTLPGQVDTLEMLPLAATEGVIYLPGAAFYADQRPSPSFRLGFTTLPIERYVEGTNRLGRAIRMQLS